VLHNTGPVLINPLENADHDQESNAVLLNGAAGPFRIGAETLESVPYVMHNSDNDDEENNTKNPRPSKTVPAYLLGTSKVAKADDGFYPDTCFHSWRRIIVEHALQLHAGNPGATIYLHHDKRV
jgi:hypothetical protein